MKTICKFSFILILAIVFDSCSKEETIQSNNDAEIASISDRYAKAKEIAVMHSQGLEYVYNKMIDSKTSSGENALRSAQDRKAAIPDFVENFILQEQIASKLSKYDAEFNLVRTGLRSSGQNSLKAITFFSSILSKNQDKTAEEIIAIFEKAIYSKKFASFSEIEQNEVLLLFAIFDDSSNYWESNLEKWEQLARDRANLRGFWDDAKRIANAILTTAAVDACGAVEPAFVGAISVGLGGAAAGSLAGGVGAGPGFVAGFVGGGVAGAVSGAITASCEASAEEMSVEMAEAVWSILCEMAVLDEEAVFEEE